MNISETENMSATIMVKGDDGKDTIAAYLSCNNMSSNANIFNGITCNATNQALLNSSSAADVAGETVAQQYEQFETAVKAKAKSLGYVIFG